MQLCVWSTRIFVHALQQKLDGIKKLVFLAANVRLLVVVSWYLYPG